MHKRIDAGISDPKTPCIPAPSVRRRTLARAWACLDGDAGLFSPLDPPGEKPVWPTRRSLPHCGVAKAAVS